MKRFVVNRHGRIVFPFNFFPGLDVSVFETLDQFEAVIKRDFEEKAHTDVEIVGRVETGTYRSSYELLRDVAKNLFWAHRYAMTLYDKRPTRWRDVPRHRGDVFVPVVKWFDPSPAATVIEAGYRALRPTWDEDTEQTIFGLLLDVFRNQKGGELGAGAIVPTAAEAIADPDALVYEILNYDPDYPIYSFDDVVGYSHRVPELEALMRHAMVIHNEFPWNREDIRLTSVGALRGDEVVLLLHPRTAEVCRFVHRAKAAPVRARSRPAPAVAHHPTTPVPPIDVSRRFTVMPRLEALATCRGEHVCTNEDLVRNAAYSWSPMTAQHIKTKTGIDQRTYTDVDLEELSLKAAVSALAKCGRRPEEFGAVLFCSCTSTKLMPSVAAWLSGQLGMFQTHTSCDLIAACAGFAYAVAEAVRLLDETGRPVLVVAGEKFSDKIGTVRTSRMLFGDASAALVIGPAPSGAPPDIEVFQTYASGPMGEVESIIWPNPDFDNDMTVYGPDVRTLVRRYMDQMLAELKILPHPEGRGSLLDAIELVVPHQANKAMVESIAEAAGLAPDRLYFDIERVGNTSSASIPIALQDAVRDGVITRPTRVFAPGFGAGAVGGYLVARIAPCIVA
ncbi:MAG: 3-ketoacyl-ACP synthase [Candidatus Rokuibacteriota bacterium]|nr:MAG: 3-ketoacyl-ACP synthase [Candidatus Rokubacteria bacterium]